MTSRSAGSLVSSTIHVYVHTVGVLFFVLSLFQLVALGAHRGWAEGAVRVVTERHTPLAPAACPDNDDLVKADCVASQTILSTARTSLAFGLFRSLAYSTANSSEVTTTVYEVNASNNTRLVQSTVEYVSDGSTTVQHSYRYFSQGNPGAMVNVVSAQAFLVMAWGLTTASWIVLVAGLHCMRSKRKSEAHIKLSSYLLLSASAGLFLCFSTWAGMPSRALTNMCVEAEGGTVTCHQLLNACEAVLADDPSAVCSQMGAWTSTRGSGDWC